MSQIGPAMPPHLSKRKREADDDNDGDGGRRVRHESPIGPAPAPAKAATAQGPTLPPQYAVNEDEIDLDYGDSDDDDTGPAPPPIKTAAAPEPTLPPRHVVNEDEIDLNYGDSDDDDAGPAPPPTISQPARPVMGPTMGPTMPPPRESESREDARKNDARSDDGESDTDDSDYGPALPGADGDYRRAPIVDNTTEVDNGATNAAFDPYSTAPSQRDDWMLAPPSDNTAANLAADPTKIRARGFATGRAAAAGGARAAGGGGAAASAIGSLWTETLQQKSQRLADTVLGRAADPRQGGSSGGPSAAAPASASSAAMAAANAERDAQIRAYTEATRGKSLYEAHQEYRHDRHDRHGRHNRHSRDDRDEDHPSKKSSKSTTQEEDDDPSARAFDREKDMRIGVQINNKQRRDLVSRAGDFGGRFSKGSFL
ncbi:hypothetical protein SBRCBS47491_006506 [Sporothrix bragantina]|uniref:DUF3752 domain-containing protein n=1 Tax=Sporothrix bragantina TaxID=671064 RepID=A0ABP0C5H1_9PEZI